MSPTFNVPAPVIVTTFSLLDPFMVTLPVTVAVPEETDKVISSFDKPELTSAITRLAHENEQAPTAIVMPDVLSSNPPMVTSLVTLSEFDPLIVIPPAALVLP